MTPPPPPAASAAPRVGAPPLRVPRAPRRVSGPAARPAARPAIAAPSHLGRLADLPWLDRLVRSRAWIGLIAVALLGIVVMQVALLRLNSGIGRAVEQATVLQRENALLAAQVARLQTGDRILGAAAKLGMVYPPAGAVTYLTPGAADAGRAAQQMIPPQQSTLGSGSTQLTQSATVSTTPATPAETTAGSAQPVTTPGAPPVPQTQTQAQTATTSTAGN
jgi:cell division protein FtsL